MMCLLLPLRLALLLLFVVLTAGDRWTRSEQAAYAEAIQARLVSLEVSP